MSMSVTPHHLWELFYSCNSALSFYRISYHGLQSLVNIISLVMACICSALVFIPLYQLLNIRAVSWMANVSSSTVTTAVFWCLFQVILIHAACNISLQGIWFLSALHDFDMTTVHNVTCITRPWQTTSSALTCLPFIRPILSRWPCIPPLLAWPVLPNGSTLEKPSTCNYFFSFL